MRTKVLLGLAALAAGAITASAQNVYSLNVVGYINLPFVEGYNLVANQLDADGTGTNNTVQGIFSTNLPSNGSGTTVYIWNPSSAAYTILHYASIKGQAPSWGTAPLAPWNPGQGAWVSIPSGAYGGAGKTGTVTTVGTVLQGALNNTAIPANGGYAIIASQIPLTGALASTLNYQSAAVASGPSEDFYLWDPVAASYNIYHYASVKGQAPKWSPSEPSIAVGQAFWVNALKGSTWATNFTVQ